MTIQHKDITGINVHEPKGIDVAAAKLVYVSSGSGSGTWKLIGSDNLLGLTGDGGISNKKLLTNGTNGFTLAFDSAYGSMAITNNNTGFAIAAAIDPTLTATQGYTVITGTGAPWLASNVDGIAFSVDRLTAPVAGVYALQATLNISQFPTALGKFSVKYLVNGSSFGTRKVAKSVNHLGEQGFLSINETVSLSATDYVQIVIASSTTGDVIINDAVVNLTLIEQLA